MDTKKKSDLLRHHLSVYWKLFTVTFTLSTCTFGGGFVIVGMMKQKFVEELGWLSEEEMLDMTAIAQSAPGALGVNIAVIVGYRLKKLKGAFVCALGAILPPLLIISLISVFYQQFKGNRFISIALQVMRAGVAAVILDVVLSLAQTVVHTKNGFWIALMVFTFLGTVVFHIPAIVLIFICGTAGFFSTCFSDKDTKEKPL
ncbi:MAG: chromate transporter [Lachnospiraceae bacterium]|nr:chromate transporter [Robinsoniella sp.]MDY3766143.1 chromate transporter [Lachnospiraceae bacterium]